MTLDEFEDKIAEYEARLAFIAEENGFKVLLMHSVIDSDYNVRTGWIECGTDMTTALLLWADQLTYIRDSFTPWNQTTQSQL